MTAMLPTRPKYAREHLTFSQDEIDAYVAAGVAKLFTTNIGPMYVVKRPEGGSIKVTPEMIVDDNAAEAALAEQDRLEALDYEVPAASWDTIEAADAMGISVGEYTDGEYRDPRPSRTARLAALGADWGF